MRRLRAWNKTQKKAGWTKWREQPDAGRMEEEEENNTNA